MSAASIEFGKEHLAWMNEGELETVLKTNEDWA
jgi:hypothetical protein